MATRSPLNKVLSVTLFVVSILALLPLTGLFSYAKCDWRTDGTARRSTAPGDEPLTTLSLSVKTGDGDTTTRLRDELAERLKARGVEQIVDNPVTRPRAQVVIEETNGRWTPFWAPLQLKTRVLLDRKRRDPNGHAIDGTVELQGTCWGLVGKDTWRAEWVPLLAEKVVDQLLPAR